MGLTFLPPKPESKTSTLVSPNTNSLYRRDSGYHTISIPATYGRINTSLPPGTVVGIVLGCVAGFIFCLYLLYLTLNSGDGQMNWGSSSVSDEVVVRRGRRFSSPLSHRRRRRPSATFDPHPPHDADVVEVEEAEQSERLSYRSAPRRSAPGGWRRGQAEHISTGDESDEGTNVIEVFEEEEDDDHGGGRSRSGRRRVGSYRTAD